MDSIKKEGKKVQRENTLPENVLDDLDQKIQKAFEYEESKPKYINYDQSLTKLLQDINTGVLYSLDIERIIKCSHDAALQFFASVN